MYINVSGSIGKTPSINDTVQRLQFLRICSNTVYGFCKIYIKLSSVDVFIVGLLYSYSLVNLTSRTVTPTGIPCLRNVDKTVFCTSGW
jgi:ABC-type uncharacterized transport system permease subunit